MLFAGRWVRIEKKCTRSLAYGTVFINMDQPRLAKIFFCLGVLRRLNVEVGFKSFLKSDVQFTRIPKREEALTGC